MSTETELKLRISPEHLAKLRRHPLFKTHQLSAPTTRHLHNIYFDTPKLDLNRKEMALRLRRVGGRWLQTLKGGGSIKGGLHQRNEWEAPVASDLLDFSILAEDVLDAYLPAKVRKKLEPVFATDFHRTSRMLAWQGAEIEVCLDKGEVKTAEHCAPICEVELELKSGEPQQLFELARAILEIVPFELESVSKAERGFRLMSGHIERPVKARMPGFSKHNSLTDVLQTLIWSCLMHFQRNLHGVMTSTDAEYLHQMRIALRRLRVVLDMAARRQADVQLEALRERLATLAASLGQVRDWDVFNAEVLQEIAAQMPEHAGLQALRDNSAVQRAVQFAVLTGKTVAGDMQACRDWQALMLDFAVWMSGPYWQQAQDEATPVNAFATRHLRRMFKHYQHAARHAEKLDARGLHALRIEAKKLRYSAECFASLFNKKKTKSFMLALGEVQEILGKVNDAAVAQRMLDGLARMPGLSAHQEAVNFARGWLTHDCSHLDSGLRKAIRHFTSQDEFWNK